MIGPKAKCVAIGLLVVNAIYSFAYPNTGSDDNDNGTAVIILPSGGRGTGTIVEVRIPENEVLILTAHHVLQPYEDKEEQPVPLRFHGDSYVFHGQIVEALTDLQNDIGAILVSKQAIPKQVRAVKLGDVDRVQEGDPVSAVGHSIATGEEWLDDQGYIKQVGLTITFSCTKADVGFSGGPVFEPWAANTMVGLLERVDKKRNVCYAASVSLLRELMNRPFRDTLLRWIDAAETKFGSYAQNKSANGMWMPTDVLPRNDNCSGSDYSVGCSFPPINTLEGGLASYDELVSKVSLALGKAWQQDNSRRNKFDKDGLRRVTFSAMGRPTRVFVNLEQSGEWYTNSVVVFPNAR